MCTANDVCKSPINAGRGIRLLFWAAVFIVAVFYGIYGYFEYQNCVLSAKFRVETQLKTLAYMGEYAKGQNIENIENIFTSGSLPKLIEIKSFMIGENKYIIYESENRPSHVIFMVFKTLHSEIIAFSVIAIDKIGKKLTMPTTAELDQDIVDAALPFLNDFLKQAVIADANQEGLRQEK